MAASVTFPLDTGNARNEGDSGWPVYEALRCTCSDESEGIVMSLGQRRRRGPWRRRSAWYRRPLAILGAGIALYAAALILTSPARSQAQSPACVATGGGGVVRVGPTRTFTTLAAGVAAANAGDTICMDPGDYPDSNGVVITKAMRILGVGGRPRLIGVGNLGNQKGLINSRAELEVVNLEFVGAAVSDASGQNGAGIRHEAGNLTVRDSKFVDNQNGILTNNNIPTIDVLIEGSTFINNGATSSGPGFGRTHGIYVASGTNAEFRDNYFEGTNNGHHLKTLASGNTVIGNTFENTNEPATLNPSYSIDIERGGNAVVQDNTFIQRSTATNSGIINYGGRTSVDHPDGSLDVIGNTVINDRSNGSLVRNNSQNGVLANVSGNRIDGISTGNVIIGPAGQADPPAAANDFGPFAAPVLQNNGIIGVTTGTPDRGVYEFATDGSVQAMIDQQDGIAGNSGITVVNGAIYVANNEQGIARLGHISDGTATTFFFGAAGIEGLATDGTDLYAGLYEEGSILHYDTSGNLLNTIMLDRDIGITGLDWFDNQFFVANFDDGNVYTFDMTGGTVGGPLFSTGLGAGMLSALAYDPGTDLASAVDDSIWLGLGFPAGGGETRRYSLDGQLLGSFASPGLQGLVASGSALNGTGGDGGGSMTTVSEPGSLILLGSMLLLLRRSRRAKRFQ